MNNDKKHAAEEKVHEEENNETVHATDEAIEESDPVSDEASEKTAENTDDEWVPKSELEDLGVKLKEMEEKLLRVQADYDNFRRRTKQEKEAAAKYRSQNLAESLLPVIDNFERAMMITPKAEETQSLLKGVQMVYNQLLEALEKEGVTPIASVGEPFDPHYHQAVMQEESAEYDSNIVIEEMQKGYRLNDRVLRPAMVKVSA
ncbi:nucleotide exchange factor GrpE [Salisediminibacterium halotolerans]|uniref:nucleotide exchange factor GrpE n=1 Tax=Salisediminibacterium halotolerans TaxID=517425 RepID=UPI000EAD33FE|nr:nucleotide exchange factor GrpE [Salisediminibacterium halotolerans]RLJ78168.1 molecular chaperone GrpE [Actinophytocola xinjiangensis]RPE88493.1 molecular chaperone GrpE [Salisediminibacterium halotolerans]TWG37145.1 molecular chaperone GrpE [Salisediminibacterium halotolerans]GEL07283.1 protein GrpE [Salisediminibacterium halotolerans]